jgi:DNA-directed RNA polymerase specialized sigma24 family protein
VEESVNIFPFRRGKTPVHTQYAAESDFCRIFEKDMNRLYLLSLLLTADSELAENCFVGGLEDSKNSNPVFKEWAQSWARRTIIVNAIRMLGPHREQTLRSPDSDNNGEVKHLPAGLEAVTELPAFDRFVFVMSVLEGYSDRECSLLLDCSSAEVARARSRAMEQLSISSVTSQKLVNIRDSQAQVEDSEVALAQELISGMAATA